jgi:hypothetical protein
MSQDKDVFRGGAAVMTNAGAGEQARQLLAG